MIMSKVIYLLLSVLIMGGCSKNDNDRRQEYTHRTVFFGSVNIKDFGSVCMMADTLTDGDFDVVITADLAKQFPEIIPSVDLDHVYTSNEYEFYKLCGLTPGYEYPKMMLAFPGCEFMEVEVRVVDFTDQGWVLEHYAPYLKCGWPFIIIGTGAAKKYLCNSTANPNQWTNWDDIIIETTDGYSLNFIDDLMKETAIVPYDWKLDL